MMRLGAVVLLSFGLAACGSSSDGQRHCNDDASGNNLKGSYCEDIDMAFTEVRLLTVSNALRIEYVRMVGTGEEKTLQIIIDGSIVNLEPNVEIKLLEAGAQVRRIIAEATAPQNLTNELEPRSSIIFSEFNLMIGSRLAGEFSILFKSGRTLAGEFEGTVADARPMNSM